MGFESTVQCVGNSVCCHNSIAVLEEQGTNGGLGTGRNSRKI